VSAVNVLRSFAEARTEDHEAIRDGITYGVARQVLQRVPNPHDVLRACDFIEATARTWPAMMRTAASLRATLGPDQPAAPPAQIGSRDLDELGQVLHDAYEQAARLSGWQTQVASRVPWDEVPEANRMATRVAAAALVAYLSTHEPQPDQEAHP
jgi:hypothetical protein